MGDNKSFAVFRLLNDIFDLEELTTFCFFQYRPVYDAFQTHDQKRTRLRRLLEHVERRALTDDLLLFVIEYAPHRKPEIEALRRKLGLTASAPASAQAAPEVVINHRAAIESFERLLTPDSAHQVLWLAGQPKMGKTHLLRKIFPSRAARQGLWAGLDLRNQAIALNPEYAAAFYNKACVYALQGKVADTLPPLRRALELDAANTLEHIPTDADFDPIRDDARFQALLAEFSAHKDTSS